MSVEVSVDNGLTALRTAGTACATCHGPRGFDTTGSADSLPVPERGPWSHRIEHVDTDAAGVVHFARLASLFETLCLELLHEHGMGLSELSADGLDLAITHVDLSFRAPLRYRDLVAGEAWAAHVGGATFHLAGRLVRREPTGSPPVQDQLLPEREVAAGRLQFAAVDADTGRARSLPSDVRQGLKGLLSHDG